MFDRNQWGKKRRAGDLLKVWPRREDGTPEKPAFLCHSAGDHMADVITIGLLESFGIPCLRQNTGDGDFGEMILGLSVTGADLFVPETMLEQAQSIIEGESEHENI